MLRKGWKQYSVQGLDGLSSQREYPLKSLNTQVNAELEAEMRPARNLATRRLTELMRLYQVSLFLVTIHKALSTHWSRKAYLQ
jgi:hypothetical protein